MKYKILGHILLGFGGAGIAYIASSGTEMLLGTVCALAIMAGSTFVNLD